MLPQARLERHAVPQFWRALRQCEAAVASEIAAAMAAVAADTDDAYGDDGAMTMQESNAAAVVAAASGNAAFGLEGDAGRAALETLEVGLLGALQV